jgi:YfiH family protein
MALEAHRLARDVAIVSAPASASGQPLAFELPGGGRALFTARADGNLSTSAGEDHERGHQRRDQLCERLQLRWLCASAQVHGTHVQRLLDYAGARGQPAPLDADGHATALPALGTTVLAADCLPVALGCVGAVAMVHAGWRGLAAGALEQGVAAVRELGRGGPIVAVIGPSAGVCCYEVGPEVHCALGEDHRRGRNADLPAIARERLAGAGVSDVRVLGACTICDKRFFSHRREGARAGRQAGIAWLS